MASSRVQSRCNLNSYQWQSRFKLWFDPWEGTVYCSVKLKGFLMVTSPKIQTRYSIYPYFSSHGEELCGCISEPNKFLKRPQRAQRSYCNHGYALGYGPQQTVALYISFHSHICT